MSLKLMTLSTNLSEVSLREFTEEVNDEVYRIEQDGNCVYSSHISIGNVQGKTAYVASINYEPDGKELSFWDKLKLLFFP